MESAGAGSGAFIGKVNAHSFKPGENPRIRYRNELNAKIEMLTAAYDVRHAQQQLMVALAARHLVDADHARRGNARVRATNAALRILNSLPKRTPPTPPPLNAWKTAP